MKYSEKTYLAALAALAALRSKISDAKEQATVDFVAEAIAEKADRDNNAGWIAVKDRPPENEIPVLVSVEKHYEKWDEKLKGFQKRVAHVVVKAFHTDGKHNTENSGFCWNGDDTNWEYVDGEDAYIISEGWWEYPYYAEEFAAVDDTVTHWMPLPETPEGVQT